MPKINILQQETTVSNLGPAPQLRAERVTSPIGETAGAFVRGLGEIQQGVQIGMQADLVEARILKQQQENDAVAWSGKVLSDARLQWDSEFLKSQETAKPGAAGFTPEFLTKFDKYAEETVKNAPTESAKKYLGERMSTLRTSLGQQALTFEAGARRDYRIDQTSETISNNAKNAQDNPANFNVLYGETIATINALEVPPREKSALLAKAKSELSYAKMFGEVQRDPQGAAAKLRGSVKPAEAGGAPAGDFKSVMKFIFEKEGGYNSNDGNGPVNFGINQAANPDVNVKALTKEGAAGIYKNRYWNAIGGDQLPAGVALMAMDTAVNQGVAFAKKILNASGGDVSKMAEMRREKYASLVQSNPGKYGKYAKTWGARVTDAEAQSLGAGGRGTGALDVATITPDRVSATGDIAVDLLSFEQRIRLLQMSDTLNNQQMALAKEQLRGKMQDFTAMATSGTAIPQASVPTVQELTAAYGEADGLKMYNDDVKPMLALNGELQRFSALSVSDRQAALTANAPKPGDGFADSSKRFQVMQQADAMLRKEMTDDPSAYTLKYAPSVAASFQRLQQTPADDMGAKSAAAIAYVNATLAEQRRLGVTDPAILPKSVTDNIVRQFFNQQEGGQNAAVLMQQQAALWGKYWPQVYGQMAKDLPGSALVIGSGMKSQPAELLARASTMKPEELKAGLPKDDIKTTEDSVRDNMTEFLASLSPMAGGDKTFNTFYDQTSKLALMYVRMGEKPSKAAERAFNDTVGEKYEFVTDRNNSQAVYRVPKQFDANSIEAGADLSLRRIETMPLEVPASLFGLDKTQSRAAYVSALKDSAYWVTAPDESGLMLYANGAAVTDTTGKPLTRSWADLSTASKPRTAPPVATPGMNGLPADADFFNLYGAPQ